MARGVPGLVSTVILVATIALPRRPEFDRREVRAPFNGVITDRLVEPGTPVSAAQGWFRISEMDATEIERIESFISRFRYQASKAALVQSRIKQLERIERLPPPEGHDRELRIRLPEAERSGRIVLEAKGLSKRYGEHVVYDHADFLIERGQRVAIVGPNGAGKTTLLKMLAEVIPIDGGGGSSAQRAQLLRAGPRRDAERVAHGARRDAERRRRRDRAARARAPRRVPVLGDAVEKRSACSSAASEPPRSRRISSSRGTPPLASRRTIST